MKQIQIGKRKVGENAPLYFIADVGANHDGDLDRALHLIELAKEAGIDAVKFQNFQAEKIVSQKGFESLGSQLSHQKAWKKPVFDVYKAASLSFDWTKKLQKKCQEVGVDYFTSPYDFEAVDHVTPYVDVYKIGSGDITWLEIVEYIGKKGKPVIIATGASTMQDVVRAMNTLESWNDQVVLMQCNTNYTADISNLKYVNLNVLKTYAARFPDVVLGLSDHTPGCATVLGAIALGARVFEKHFTDDNLREGPDHKFAMIPSEWKNMIDRAKELDAALGNGVKVVEKNESDTVVAQRRCVRLAKSYKAGHLITRSNLEILRPAPKGAFEPYKLAEVIGRKLAVNKEKGEALYPKDLK